MKCSIPEIAWHNRDPVLSVDFQPIQNQKEFIRLATGGCDSHVVIWYIKTEDSGSVVIEVAADLVHHQKAVNVVRWSPNGELLASGDDESAIIIWKQKTDVDPPQIFEVNDEQDRETWNVFKILRGHVEDVYDLSWCPLSRFLVSGSVDNTAIMWDVPKGSRTGMLHHKGFVQGVAWDPNNQYAVTMSSDRVFRVFDVNSKKVLGRSSKTVLPLPVTHPLHGQTVRLYHDDTLQSFFRRLDFSPDGELIAVPTGLIEGDQNRGLKNMNATYIYSRYSLAAPICILPCGESPALAVRWSPVKYALRPDGPPALINLPNPVRMILAIGANDSISIYDTQQNTPLAVVLNPQYARLTDLTWSNDGNILIVSSSDGYCSIITFTAGELGEVLCTKEPTEEISNKEGYEPIAVDVNLTGCSDVKKGELPQANKIDGTPGKGEKNNIKTPNKRSPSVKKISSLKKTVVDLQENKETEKIAGTLNVPGKNDSKLLKTPKHKSPKPKSASGKKKAKADELDNKSAGVVVMDEAAMEAWSQDGFFSKTKSPPVLKTQSNVVIIDDPTQDLKLVYEETEDNEKSSKNDSLNSEKSGSVSEKTDAVVKKSPLKIESKPSLPSLPKTGRRVNLITLSSPKSKKKLN